MSKGILSGFQSWYTRFQVSKSPQMNLVWGFFLYNLLGFLLLSIPLFHREPVSFLNNLFISTSAISTTGLVTVSVYDSYNIGGQLIIMSLFQIGGIGLSTGITGDLTNTGKVLIIILMFIGRVGVLTFGFALLERKREQEEPAVEDDLAV